MNNILHKLFATFQHDYLQRIVFQDWASFKAFNLVFTKNLTKLISLAHFPHDKCVLASAAIVVWRCCAEISSLIAMQAQCHLA